MSLDFRYKIEIMKIEKKTKRLREGNSRTLINPSLSPLAFRDLENRTNDLHFNLNFLIFFFLWKSANHNSVDHRRSPPNQRSPSNHEFAGSKSPSLALTHYQILEIFLKIHYFVTAILESFCFCNYLFIVFRAGACCLLDSLNCAKV